MAEPKCPECNVEGIEHIVSKDSQERAKDQHAWFQVAYCDNCGHIYGVFANTPSASAKPARNWY